MKIERRSERRHWDDFWKRDRDLDEIYDNDNRILEEITSRMEVDGKLIMEVGAATARDSVALAARGAITVALDYSHEALRLAGDAAGRADVPLLLVCGDALALPFKDGCFDVIFHQGVLEHFRDPRPLLLENSRVLGSGGQLLVDVPQTLHPYTVIKKVFIAFDAWFAGWETQFTVRSLSNLLRSVGLVPTDSYGRFFSPSLAYRMFREALIRMGRRLPLRPVLLPPVHRLRGKVRKAVEGSPAGPVFGCIIGVFARKDGD